jgi:hypothetical protein
MPPAGRAGGGARVGGTGPAGAKFGRDAAAPPPAARVSAGARVSVGTGVPAWGGRSSGVAGAAFSWAADCADATDIQADAIKPDAMKLGAMKPGAMKPGAMKPGAMKPGQAMAASVMQVTIAVEQRCLTGLGRDGAWASRDGAWASRDGAWASRDAGRPDGTLCGALWGQDGLDRQLLITGPFSMSGASSGKVAAVAVRRAGSMPHPPPPNR